MNTVSNQTRKTQYISSIDGLRAISIFLVLLFHADIPAFKGGYIGVDVFFVISGFFITRMIVADLETNKFSLGRFFMRRYTRLTPALLTTVALTAIAGWAMLTPRQIIELSNETLAAAFSLSNIFFYVNSGYFDGNSLWKPLLHTWSLGVEEQFYFLWPIVLLACFRTKRQMVILISLISLTSFIATTMIASRDPSAAFYLTPFRVYQLGVGGVLALTSTRLFGKVGNASTVAGFLIIASGSVVFSGDTNVVVAGGLSVIGASLFILGSKSQIADTIFGHAAMTYIGRRAYSIYLVHWPLIVLGRPISQQYSIWISAPLLIAISLALGEILHRLVEKRFHFSSVRAPQAGKRNFSARGWIAAHTTIASIAGAAMLLSNNILPTHDSLAKAIDLTRTERDAIAKIARWGQCSLTDGDTSFDTTNCLSAATEKETVVLMGDSFGIDTAVAIHDAFNDRYHLAQANKAGCAPVIKSDAWKPRVPCEEFNALRFKLLDQQPSRKIVLASNWNAALAADVVPTIRELVSKGFQVYVIGVRAVFDQDVTDIFIQSGSSQDANLVLRSHFHEPLRQLDKDFRDQVSAAGGKYINVLEEQCGLSCNAATEDGRLLYIDAAHFSRAGMEFLARTIVSQTNGNL
ncbi:acyltransferase family protein [Rhizobium skierniewicense]|uniref:acyltransferase family protein n=1 Tax=Rhizobium skierniewicense TaxID=984260 RepID=UPI001573EDB6|nr:acyltransferase family protein [Rhizobium skierniewicense]NTF32287.1 acyltransferase [Rhizobium skierniewicense]